MGFRAAGSHPSICSCYGINKTITYFLLHGEEAGGTKFEINGTGWIPGAVQLRWKTPASRRRPRRQCERRRARRRRRPPRGKTDNPGTWLRFCGNQLYFPISRGDAVGILGRPSLSASVTAYKQMERL